MDTDRDTELAALERAERDAWDKYRHTHFNSPEWPAVRAAWHAVFSDHALALALARCDG